MIMSMILIKKPDSNKDKSLLLHTFELPVDLDIDMAVTPWDLSTHFKSP